MSASRLTAHAAGSEGKEISRDVRDSRDINSAFDISS